MNPSQTEHLYFSIFMHLASLQVVEEVKELLQASTECILSRNGCLECSTASDASDPMKVQYREQWKTELLFQNHVESPEFMHVLAAIDMCCEIPEVQIGKLVISSGVDSLRRIYFEGTEDPGRKRGQ